MSEIVIDLTGDHEFCGVGQPWAEQVLDLTLAKHVYASTLHWMIAQHASRFGGR